MNRYSLEDVSLCLTHISKNPRNLRNLREKTQRKLQRENLTEKKLCVKNNR